MSELKLRSSFLEVMGVSPINKVLDFLIENDRESWNMNEISEHAEVGYSTLKLILPKLLDSNLIFVKKRFGKIKLFSINKEYIVTKEVIRLYKMINKVKVNEELQKSI